MNYKSQKGTGSDKRAMTGLLLPANLRIAKSNDFCNRMYNHAQCPKGTTLELPELIHLFSFLLVFFYCVLNQPFIDNCFDYFNECRISKEIRRKYFRGHSYSPNLLVSVRSRLPLVDS